MIFFQSSVFLKASSSLLKASRKICGIRIEVETTPAADFLAINDRILEVGHDLDLVALASQFAGRQTRRRIGVSAAR